MKMQTIITELNMYVAWCLYCVTPCINCVLLWIHGVKFSDLTIVILSNST
jgi:hypothetical protein